MLERFLGRVEGGKLIIKSQKALDTYLAQIPDGKDVFVTIKPVRRTRSLPQNAWYWGCVLPLISEHTGHSVEELHEIFKRLFLPPKYIEYRGKEIKLPSSTTATDTLEFATFVDRVRAEAANMGIVIPEPGQADI